MIVVDAKGCLGYRHYACVFDGIPTTGPTSRNSKQLLIRPEVHQSYEESVLDRYDIQSSIIYVKSLGPIMLPD